MRWIFILLLVANVIYFGVEFDRESAIRQRQTGSVVAVPVSAQNLKLLAELPVPPEPRTIDTGVDELAVAAPAEPDLPVEGELVTDLPDIDLTETDNALVTYHCFRYGPLMDEDQMQTLQQWFTTRNATAESSYVEEQGKQLFWIYLAPQPSRENAMAVLEEMQKKGIGDFRLINRGDLQNAISLGLFSSREAVNARLEELKEKGYVPVVVPYADVKRVYTLDVQFADTSGLLAQIGNAYPARYESTAVPCNPASTSEYSPEPVL
jgi:hypothetical protein